MNFKNLYIVKQENGKLHRFYHEDGHGICYEILDDNIWTNKLIIFEAAKDNFIVLLKDNDEIVVLVEDNDGNIQKISCFNAHFENQIMLYRKTSVDYNLQLSACYEGDSLHLFYNIPDKLNEEEALIHQVLPENAVWNPPRLIDTLCNDSRCLFKTITCNDNVYILYTTPKDKEIHLVYRKYNSQADIWESSITIDKSHSFFVDCSIVPAYGTIHILYIKNDETDDKLLYKSLNGESYCTQLIYHGQNLKNCVLDLSNNFIHTLWSCDDNMYSCSFPYEDKHSEDIVLKIESKKANAFRAYYLNNNQIGEKFKFAKDLLIDAESVSSFILSSKSLDMDTNSFDYVFEASTNEMELYINKIKSIFNENYRKMRDIKKELKNKDNELYKLCLHLNNNNIENESLQNSLRKLRISIENLTKLNTELKDKNLALEEKLFNQEQKLKLQKYRLQGYQEQIDILTNKNIECEKEIALLKKAPSLSKEEEYAEQPPPNQGKRSLLKWIFEDDINQ